MQSHFNMHSPVLLAIIIRVL